MTDMSAQFAIFETRKIDEALERLARLEEKIERCLIAPAPEWVSISQAADMVKMSITTVKRAIAAGYVEATGEGKRRRVNVASLKAHFEAGKASRRKM